MYDDGQLSERSCYMLLLKKERFIHMVKDCIANEFATEKGLLYVCFFPRSSRSSLAWETPHMRNIIR